MPDAEKLRHLHHPGRLTTITAGVILLIAELNAAANSSTAPKTEYEPPCVEPTPNAKLIPLAYPGDDKAELIPLAPLVRNEIKTIPTITEPIAPSCPVILES